MPTPVRDKNPKTPILTEASASIATTMEMRSGIKTIKERPMETISDMIVCCTMLVSCWDWKFFGRRSCLIRKV